MALSVRNVQSANNGAGSTSLTITKPTNTASGDFLFATIAVDGGSGNTITPPSGWTLELRTNDGTALALATYYKLAGASEPADYTWTLSPSAGASGGIYAIIGADTASPINTSIGKVGSSQFASWSDVLTTTTYESLLIYTQSSESGTIDSGPTGMTSRYDTNGAANVRCSSWSELYSPKGYVGNKAAVKSAAAAYIANFTAFKPASGGDSPAALVNYGTFDITDNILNWEEGLTSRIELIEMARRHGFVVPKEPLLDPRMIKIFGTFTETSQNDLRRKIEQLGGYLLFQTGESSKVRDIAYISTDINPLSTPTLPNGGFDFSRNLLRFYENRCASAYCVGYDYEFSPGTGLQVASWSADFLLHDPFWYDGTINSDGFISYLTYTKEGSSSLTFSVTVNGNARVFPVIRVGSAITGIKAPKVDITFQRAATTTNDPTRSFIIQNGASNYNKDYFEVYTSDIAVATAAGLNGNQYIAANSVLWWLEPGNNDITITWTGGANTLIEMVFRNRYY